ncbi:MAG: DUF5360 family protein [Sphingomonas sp.]
MHKMPKSLAIALTATDLMFLAYWSLSLLHVAHIITLPSEIMYSDFRQPRVVAWNWSFLPLDLIFSGCGLTAVAASRCGNIIWRPLALMSLAFTIAAGWMAISYWILLGEFNPGWFIPNLILALWPLFFLPRLIKAGFSATISG